MYTIIVPVDPGTARVAGEELKRLKSEFFEKRKAARKDKQKHKRERADVRANRQKSKLKR